MLISEILERDGIPLRREAATNGGELAGPCPFCGGRDRFRVWPEKGRYWCRQCGARGDAIQYLRDRKGLSYLEACAAIGTEPEDYSSPQEKKPKVEDWLSVEWQMAALDFLGKARLDLQRCAGALAYLRGRGLRDETIARLGFNRETRRMDRAAWGLPDEINPKTGKPRRVWIPRGIVIPTMDHRDGALVHRIRVRLSADEFERSKEWTSGRGIKYAELPGSGVEPLLLPGKGEAWAVVESELDACLIHQEAGDLVNVLGLGSAQAIPGPGIMRRIQGSRTLVALDADDAGVKSACGFWRSVGEFWPVPEGKDPGDYFQTGGSIREWIEAGLRESAQPAPLQETTEAVSDDRDEDIAASEDLSSLPCRAGLPCYHDRGGSCFYKSNLGPISHLDGCPMILGFGEGEAHPDIDALYRQRERIEAARKRAETPYWRISDGKK